VTRALHALIQENDLVAVQRPPGPGWRTILSRAWDAGAAVLPVDSRLSAGESANLLERACPTVIIGRNGGKRIDAGMPMLAGRAVVVATSGSTDRPRLVEIGRDALEAAVQLSSAALGAGADDRWLCCLPVAHIGGLLVLYRHLILGAPVTVHERFSVEGFQRARDVAFTSLVPTQLGRLIEAGCTFNHLKAILVGGSALSAELAERAVIAGARVVATYGLTESCGGVVYAGHALEGVEVRADDSGQLLIRGPTLMRAYRFDDVATRGAFTDDGWLRTGDAGEVSTDGAVRVFGRMSDVIVSGGEKVWPAEVEAALATHPEIADVAVSGTPDPEWGERVVAYVVPRNSSSPPALEAIRDYAATRIARYKVPHELVLVESLDRTALGKVRR
jgi:O-succinylbenzoic acid--CoA ligase